MLSVKNKMRGNKISAILAILQMLGAALLFPRALCPRLRLYARLTRRYEVVCNQCAAITKPSNMLIIPSL
jgi:hypothetical protein